MIKIPQYCGWKNYLSSDISLVKKSTRIIYMLVLCVRWKHEMVDWGRSKAGLAVYLRVKYKMYFIIIILQSILR